MPIYVATGTQSPGFKYNGVDLSDHVRQVEVQMNAADVDITAMGATSQAHAPGLRDDRYIIQFFQDFKAAASGAVDATISPLVGVAAGATAIVYAAGTTPSSTAPSYTMVAAVFEYSPLNVEIGAASETTVTFLPAAGSSISRGTA